MVGGDCSYSWLLKYWRFWVWLMMLRFVSFGGRFLLILDDEIMMVFTMYFLLRDLFCARLNLGFLDIFLCKPFIPCLCFMSYPYFYSQVSLLELVAYHA